MLFLILSLVTAALALPEPSELHNRQSSAKCVTTGVHMIVARASTESPGIGGLLAPLVSGIQQLLPGSDYEAVDFPASLVDYGGSISTGVSSTLTAGWTA